MGVEESLNGITPGSTHDLQFAGRLNPFGDHCCATGMAHVNHTFDDFCHVIVVLASHYE